MTRNGQKPIVIAMSGGVDSSLAAALLLERNPGKVIGLTMQLWDQTRLTGANGHELPIVHSGRCCSLDDAYDARRVAEHLDFPFYVINFQRKFEETVVRPFVESYLSGETPVPCTLCNNHVKFDELVTYARQVGAVRVATGHYCRVRHNPGTSRYELLRARDLTKDQTYFLFGLTQDQLAFTDFPLGELTKKEVRELARQRKLPVAEKQESQEICFVPTGDYSDFIAAYLKEQGNGSPGNIGNVGEIVNRAGKVLGAHNGLHGFTVGQRRGLGVAAAEPLYVVELDRDSNRVIVGGEEDLYRSGAEVRGMNWVSVGPPAEPVRCRAKIRHRHDPVSATYYPEGVGASNGKITFDEPQRAITPGQAAVLYAAEDAAEPELVLGGGWLTANTV